MNTQPQTNSGDTLVKTLAFDPGFGGIKLYGPKGGLTLQSAVSINGNQTVRRMDGLRTARPPLCIETAAGSFYVGDNAHDWGRPVENLDFERLNGSPEMLALFLGAMTRYETNGAINLIVGLPIAALSGDDAAATRRTVRSFLRGSHTWLADGVEHTLTVENATVTSQPVGALFDYLLTDDGTMPPEKRILFTKRELGVLGIGMNTVDLLVIRDRKPVQRFTAGKTAGVRRLLELLNQDGLYSMAELDALLRRKALDVSQKLPVWEREVLGIVERQWGRTFRRFANVVVVGGGAILLRNTLLTRFGTKAFVPDDPVIATARGLFKYVMMKANQSK
ncbi:MAG: ParM/StbA family protein [Chloroflexi bacterium]|nr:ParM/StbA family protein [Chloroflexota bacterium]